VTKTIRHPFFIPSILQFVIAILRDRPLFTPFRTFGSFFSPDFFDFLFAHYELSPMNNELFSSPLTKLCALDNIACVIECIII